MERLELLPKVLMVSNNRKTGPLLSMSLKHQQHLNVVVEPIPENAVNRFLIEIPDLIILDLTLDDNILMELIKALRLETAIPILLLTTNRSEEFMVQAYEAGADECILKPIGPSLFHVKVNVWLRRCSTILAQALNTIKVGCIKLVPADKIVVLENGSQIRLTNLELRLLYSLMRQPGQAIPFEALIEQVWGSATGGDTVTLKNVVYRLRRKIEVNPANPTTVQTVAGVGYRFIAPGL